MAQVFFFSYARGASPLHGLERLFAKSAAGNILSKGGKVAIKLHMGELGNVRYIRPAFASKVVDMVKGTGGDPFLFDTVVNYPSARDTKEKYLSTAAWNGFTSSSVGAPIVITDDDDTLVTIPVRTRIDGCHLREIKVPSLLLECPSMVVLSHVKGHDLSGFGGALKNMAMGCVSTDTKRAQHSVNMPEFNEGSDCDGCGKCAEACPTDAIVMVDGRPQRTVSECTYCCTCFFECPKQCWVWPEGAKEKVQVCMAHVASTLLAEYRGKAVFVNFIQDVAPHCDCAAPSGRPVVEDVGIVCSFDPVAVDMASLDLIDQSALVPGATSATPPDILGKIHETSCRIQLETAQKLGMGTMDYDLVPV